MVIEEDEKQAFADAIIQARADWARVGCRCTYDPYTNGHDNDGCKIHEDGGDFFILDGEYQDPTSPFYIGV